MHRHMETRPLSWCYCTQVACNVASGPRPTLTTFKKNVSVDLRDEGSGAWIRPVCCTDASADDVGLA